MSDVNTTNNSFPLLTAVQIFFILEKIDVFPQLITPIPEWSWWWVFSPVWISLAIYAFFGGIIGVIAARSN